MDEKLQQFEKVMRTTPDERFNSTLTKAVLGLSDEQVEAVSFVFWLCYTAEKDLNGIFQQSWKLAIDGQPDEAAQEIARAQIKEMIVGKKIHSDDLERVLKDEVGKKREEILGIIKDHYQKRRDVDIEKLDYFIDKILVFQGFFGSVDLTKLLWKLNELRNKVSHGDIDNLTYNDVNLRERSAREALLFDFVRFTSEFDSDKSPVWNSLSDEQKAEVEKRFEEIRDKLQSEDTDSS